MPISLAKNQDQIRALLKRNGMRATAQRLAVLLILKEKQSPMTHEQVMGALSGDLYDKASIWRVLSDLANAQIVRRMDLGDRVWRYELNDDGRALSHDHSHFLCERCGTVTCLPSLEVRTKDGLLPTALLHADYRIRISGRCAVCVAA